MATAFNHLQPELALRQQALAPLYLIVGEEDLLRDRALAALKTVALGESENDFNYNVLYGGEISGGEIAGTVAEMPVFAERRLVVVKAAEKISARDGEQLLESVKNPNSSTTLVFMSAKLDGRLKFSQALARAAVVIDCAPLRDSQLPAWVASEAQHVGVRVSDEATQLLKEVCGSSLYGLRRELEKLAAYIPADRSVTSADVQVLRGIDPGASVFDLTLAIAEGRHGRTLTILARNLESGEAPLRILGSLVWQYRRLWKSKELLAQQGREGEVARVLRMDPWKVRPFLNQFSESHLQAALRLCFEADEKLKGGSGSSPRMVLESVLWKLCQSVAGSKNEPPPRRTPAPPKPGAGRVVSNVRTIRRQTRTER